jgi:L-threonylcarbamoyladenylate synthase
MTERLAADAAGLARAAALLRQGALVAFPTETVYGLGGDARSAAAVAAIFAAKGRPARNPLIVHVADAAAAAALAPPGDDARALAAAFWPGPLTLVLPLAPAAGLAAAVTAGLPTVALRVPAHPVARALLDAFGGPLAAPSANPSGRVSPTTAAHVLDGLGGRIAAVIDAGPCPVGLESTIVGLAGEARLLRPGGLPAEAIEACLGRPLARRGEGAAITAPGQLVSHYAPAARLRLAAEAPRPGEVWIAFGAPAELTLSASGDLHEAAARLYALLREADRRAGPGGTIAVAPVPGHGLGAAINDRLRRAAAPR